MAAARSGSACLKLRFPCRDLVRIDVEMPRHLGDGSARGRSSRISELSIILGASNFYVSRVSGELDENAGLP